MSAQPSLLGAYDVLCYSPRKWWDEWLKLWANVCIAIENRWTLIERYNLQHLEPELPPVIDQRIVDGGLAGLLLIAAPPDWVPDDHVPHRRSECKDGPRPCTHVRCAYNCELIRGEDRPGTRRDTHDLPEDIIVYRGRKTNCALDIAESDERTADEVGAAMGIVGERVLQLTTRASLKARGFLMIDKHLESLWGEFPPGLKMEAVLSCSFDGVLPPDHHAAVIVYSAKDQVPAQPLVQIRKRKQT